MNQKTIILCCSLLLLLGCTSNNSKNAGLNEVKPYPHTINISEGFENVSQLKLSDIADSIRYIVLSKDKKVLMANIKDIQISDKNIFLQSDEQVMRFDLSGNYLNSFGSIGRGPEEYLASSSYSLTSKFDKVFILRNMMQDYLIYTYDGTFVGKRDLPVPGAHVDFVAVSDSSFFLTSMFFGMIMNADMLNAMPFIAGLFDIEGKSVTGLDNPLRGAKLSEAELKTIVVPNPSLSYFENRILVTPEDDTIYKLDGDSISPAFIFNWGQIPHPEGFDELYTTLVETSNQATNYKPLIETPTKAFFRSRYMSDEYIFEYDKITGNSRSMMVEKENIGLINDLDGGTNYYPTYLNRAGDIWIVKEDAFTFKKNHSAESLSTFQALYPDMKDNLKIFLDSLKQDDNPVLKIVYLKHSATK